MKEEELLSMKSGLPPGERRERATAMACLALTARLARVPDSQFRDLDEPFFMYACEVKILTEATWRYFRGRSGVPDSSHD